MGGSSKKVTVGYEYYLGMHMVLCHGPVDKITRIQVDERTAWSGSRSGGRININATNLFGGESREGGISGGVDIMMGEPTQGTNDYLNARLQSRVPAFRGVVSAVLRQVYVGLNPYLKPWAFRLTRVMQRQDGIPQWYPETAPIPVADGFGVRQRLMFSLDTSGSMGAVVGNGVTRLDLMKQNMIKVLDEIGYMAQDAGANGVAIDVSIRTLSGGGLSYTGVTAANIASLKSYVNGLSASGGTNFQPTFSAAKSWFSAHSGERRNALIIVTDGLPDPAADFPLALDEGAPIINKTGTWSGNNEVDVYVVNIDLDNTNYSEQMDNTRGDGVPVVSGASADELYNAVFAAFMGDTIAMNVIHAIRECLTDPTWGMGLPESEIDDASFRAAAKRLRDERLGVCFLWDRQKTIQEIVQELLKHADAALYVDRKTGLFTIKLVRDDYVKANVLHLTEEHIIKVEDFNRVTFGELATAVTVNYDNVMTGKTSSIRVEDIALASLQQAHIETTLQYPCFPDATMAGRAAQRQLRLLSSQLASCTVHAGRAAANLTVGDPVRITWPEYDLYDVVFRVTSVAYGDGKSNRVKLSLTEDVFATPTVEVVRPAPPEWEDPAAPPNQVERFYAIEAPYYELVQLNGQDTVDILLASRPDSSMVAAGTMAPPGPMSINARFYTNAGLGYEDIGTVDFSPGGTLANAVGRFDTSFTLVTATMNLEDVTWPLLGQIGTELVWVTASSGNVLTVTRGVLDTVPQAHAAGEHLVLWDNFLTIDSTEYSTSEQVRVKLQPVNGSGAAPLDGAAETVIDIVGRPARPYRPADFRVNGILDVDPSGYLSYPATLTWVHRNRLQETAGFPLAWTDASVTPEDGTTYRIKTYGVATDNSVTPGEVIEAGSGTSYVLDLASITVPDGAFLLRVDVYAVRDGLESYQAAQQVLPLLTPPETVTLEAGTLFAPDALTVKQLEN